MVQATGHTTTLVWLLGHERIYSWATRCIYIAVTINHIWRCFVLLWGAWCLWDEANIIVCSVRFNDIPHTIILNMLPPDECTR